MLAYVIIGDRMNTIIKQVRDATHRQTIALICQPYHLVLSIINYCCISMNNKLQTFTGHGNLKTNKLITSNGTIERIHCYKRNTKYLFHISTANDMTSYDLNAKIL